MDMDLIGFLIAEAEMRDGEEEDDTEEGRKLEMDSKEYQVCAFQEGGKWFYRLTDASTWNTIVLTESQYEKCLNHGIKVFNK